MAHGRWAYPKDLLYSQLATDTRCPAGLTLRFKNVCQLDSKACNTETWHQTVQRGIRQRYQTSA